MTLNEYCEYLTNPLGEAKARVVIVPPGESWTALRRFCKERDDVELRLSDLVTEVAWLPMPDEVFGRVREAMTAMEPGGKAVVLLGLPGYLALLTDEDKRAAIVALRKWVDGTSGREAVCFLGSDDGTESVLKDVFVNPRYRQGKQLIQILPLAAPKEETIAGRAEVMVIGDDLACLITGACDTFQKYLFHTEEHPNDSSVRRVVVASEGRPLPGLSPEVRQVVCLRDLARVFYDVEDMGLSEDALRWMCERGKDGAGITLSEKLMTLFFPEGGVLKHVLRVFDERKGGEREAVLWLVKHAATTGSYLKSVIGQAGISVENFRYAYVAGAAEWLDDAATWASERKDAVQEADVKMFDAYIRRFIARCAAETTSRVAPWLNCGTRAEVEELLRRCAVDGIVLNAVKEVYPEAAAYLDERFVFGDAALDRYFRDYRELKMAGRVTQEFYATAERLSPPSSVQSRDAIVQRYSSDTGCGLLVVDAMGAEWLPMLVTLALQRNISVDSIEIGEARLPTSTKFNFIHWPDETRRLPGIKRFDNIAHKGVEAHETRSPEENLAAALDVINSEVLPRVAEGLERFERVLVSADHGSSRLAALAWQSEPRRTQTLTCEEGAEIADWRYRERAAEGKCPPKMEETLDGSHWVVRGYDRLPKKGGGQGFELHGGATLEERLVPVVIFSRTVQSLPKAKTDGKRAQIVEKDEFDL